MNIKIYRCLILFIMFAPISAIIAGAYSKFPKYNLNADHYEGIAVDSSGNIYLGNMDKGQIEIYSASGDSVNTIKFETEKGAFSFNVYKNKQLEVGICRTDKKLIYNLNGKILNVNNDKNAYDEIRTTNKYRCVDYKGNNYEIVNSFWGAPHVNVINKAGVKTTLLAVSENKRKSYLPFQLFIIIFITLILIPVAAFLIIETRKGNMKLWKR